MACYDSGIECMNFEESTSRSNLPCVPSRATVAISFLIIVVYSLIAWVVGGTFLQIVTLSAQRGLSIEPLAMELLVLWTVACLVGGGLQVRRLRGQPFVVRFATVVFVPLWLMVVFSIYEVYKPVPAFRRMGGTATWWDYTIAIVIWVMALYCILSVVFVYRMWRRWGLVGLCQFCQYDLRGNVSGVCPECGFAAEKDTRISRYYFKKEFKWFPELGEFERPSERQEAMKKAKIANLKSFTGIVLLFAGCGPLIVYLLKDDGIAGWWSWEMGGVLVVYFATFWISRIRLRRLLREQLDSSGGRQE